MRRKQGNGVGVCMDEEDDEKGCLVTVDTVGDQENQRKGRRKKKMKIEMDRYLGGNHQPSFLGNH